MAEYMRYKPPIKRKRISKPRKTNLQSVWETRLMMGEAEKQYWKELYKCDSLELAYCGHQEPEDWDEDMWFTLNLIFSSANILKRNVCPKELQVNLSLQRTYMANPQNIPVIEQIVKVREAYIQYVFDSQDVWKEGQQAYLDTLWQFGVLKTGYSADLVRNANAGRVMRDPNGRISTDENGEWLTESDWIVEFEEFFVDRVDPDLFVVNHGCGPNLDRHGRWCAQKFFMPLEEAKKEPYWNKQVLSRLGPSALEEYEMDFLQKDTGQEYMSKYNWWGEKSSLPEDELIVGYEIYDLKRREFLVVVRGAHSPVVPPSELPPGVNLHPFTIVKFYERKASFYPIPVAFNWLAPQLEYNITRTQTMLHRRRFNRKYGYIENAIDETEVNKFEKGKDGTLIKFNQAGAIEPIKDAPLDQSYGFDTKVLREEFMETTNVGKLQRAMVGAESATEAEIVEQRAREGEIDEHEHMMVFMSEVSKKLNDSMEENLTQEGAVRVIGPQGANWVSFGPQHFDKIAGEILFNAQVSAGQRMTLQVERAQLLQLLDILGKNPLLMLDDMLLRAVLDKFPALANNELLLYRLMQLGMIMFGANQRGGGEPKKIEAKSTGSEASSSRKVATGA